MYGHEALLDRLGSSLAIGRFPQVSLFTGPAGVGKQRVALWVGQGLLCEGGPGAPCGSCAPCRQVRKLTHPDLHWFVPIARPKATDPSKQIGEAQELLAAAIADRRAEPKYSSPEGMIGYPIAAIRLLHRIAGLTPYSGKRKVFVLGDADRLVVQQASQEAANALLKVLEEPLEDTVIILTSSRAEALLPTIRSRLVPLRIGRVADSAVERFIHTEMDENASGTALQRRVLSADGSIGQVIAAGDAAGAEADAAAFLETAEAGGGGFARKAFRQQPWAARGAFTDTLDAMALSLRDRLRDATSPGNGKLRRTLEALKKIEATRLAAQGNVNPQLALAVLGRELEELA